MIDNPFTWSYLTTTPGPNETVGFFAIGFVLLFLAGFSLSVSAASGGLAGFLGNNNARHLAMRWGKRGTLFFGVGLFFFLCRFFQVGALGLGMRIWLWACLGLFVALSLAFLRDYFNLARARH